MIILTSRTPPGTLARKLIDSPSLTSIMLEMKKRINLQGAELDEFERQREAEKAEKAKIKQEEADSSDESDSLHLEYCGKLVKLVHPETNLEDFKAENHLLYSQVRYEVCKSHLA